MKVVINKCYGGFGLSNAAVESCIALGVVGFFKDGGVGADQYYCEREDDKEFRCDQRLVQVVEQLGDKANGAFSKLMIVDIPFNSVEGWYIEDHDGWEHIAEDHMCW